MFSISLFMHALSARKIGILLISICLIVMSYLHNVTRLAPFFAAYDPYYHAALTQQFLDIWTITRTIPQAATADTLSIYTTLLQPLVGSTHLLLWVPVHELFLYGGGMLLVLSFLVLVVLGKVISRSLRAGLLLWWLWVGSSYILIRHSMLLPENMALLLLFLLFLFLYQKKYRRSLLVLFFYGYVHYRSWYVPLGIIGFYELLTALTMHGSRDRKLRYLVQRMGGVFCVLLISYPINTEFAASVWYIISWYLGLLPHRSTIAPDSTLYVVPMIQQLYDQIGSVQGVLVAVGLLLGGYWSLRGRKQNRVDSFRTTVLLVCGALLVAYFSPLIAKSVPSYRFAAYLVVIALVVIAGALRQLQSYRFVSVLTMSVTVLLAAQHLAGAYGWSGVTQGDLDAVAFLETQPDVSAVISFGSPVYTMHPRGERDPEISARLLYATGQDAFMQLLETRYQTWTIFVVATTNQMKARTKQRLPVEQFLKPFIVHHDEREYTTVYKIDMTLPSSFSDERKKK